MTTPNPSTGTALVTSVTVDARGQIAVDDGDGGTLICCDLGPVLDMETRGWLRLDPPAARELAQSLSDWAARTEVEQ